MIEFEHEKGGLVRLAFLNPPEPGDEERYLESLQALARLTTPFVVLAVLAGGRRLSQAGEREQALWYKASRQQLERACRGMAIVRPNADGPMQATFARLWTFPVLVTGSESGAREWLAGFTVSETAGQ